MDWTDGVMIAVICAVVILFCVISIDLRKVKPAYTEKQKAYYDALHLMILDALIMEDFPKHQKESIDVSLHQWADRWVRDNVDE